MQFDKNSSKILVAIISIELIYILIARIITSIYGAYTFEAEIYRSINRFFIFLIVLYFFKNLIFQNKVNANNFTNPILIFALMLFLAIPVLESYMDLVTTNFKILFAFASIFVALHEEIVYRGVIQNFLLQKYSPIQSILITSIIFTIYHIGAIDWYINLYIQVFLASIILGFIYYKTNSFVLVVILHTLYDALVVFTPLAKTLRPIITYQEATYLMIVVLVLVIFWYKKEQ